MLTRLAAAPAASQQLPGQKQAPVRVALLSTAARCWHCFISCSPVLAQVFVGGFVFFFGQGGQVESWLSEGSAWRASECAGRQEEKDFVRWFIPCWQLVLVCIL